MLPATVVPEAPAPEGEHDDRKGASTTGAECERLKGMFVQHFEFIWRSLRHLGLSQDNADDAAQQVFIVASRKLAAIDPERERSFLFGTAMRVASDIRRSAVHRREIPYAEPAEYVESEARPDELLEQRRARELVDAALDEMDLDLRSVFVLYEIEEMTAPEIAALLAVPIGTVSSRLRRARKTFESRIERLKRNSLGPSRLEGGVK